MKFIWAEARRSGKKKTPNELEGRIQPREKNPSVLIGNSEQQPARGNLEKQKAAEVRGVQLGPPCLVLSTSVTAVLQLEPHFSDTSSIS